MIVVIASPCTLCVNFSIFINLETIHEAENGVFGVNEIFLRGSVSRPKKKRGKWVSTGSQRYRTTSSSPCKHSPEFNRVWWRGLGLNSRGGFDCFNCNVTNCKVTSSGTLLIRIDIDQLAINAEPSSAYFLKKSATPWLEKLVMFTNQLAVGNVNMFSQSVQEADYVKPE